MAGFYLFLCTLLVFAIVFIALWLWLAIDILAPIAELIRIKLEEQVAVWRIESISRISQLEQRRIRDEHRPG